MLMITGASGQLGKLITSQLKAVQTEFVEGTREVSDGHASSRRIDFEHPTSLDFSDVTTLLLISAGYGEDDQVIARHAAAIHAAERDGVKQVIYTSLTGAGDHLTFALAHRWTEARLQRSAMKWTILRNGLYAELLGQLTQSQEGVVTTPFGEGRLAAVARADLAEVAAKVASQPDKHACKVYELVGTVAIGGRDVAQAQAAEYRPRGLTETRTALLSTGLAPFQIPMLMSIYSAIAGGFLKGTGGDLRWLLGKEPRPALQHLR